MNTWYMNNEYANSYSIYSQPPGLTCLVAKKRQLINHRKYDKNYLLNLHMLRLIIRNLYHDNNNDDITCVTLLTLWPYLLLYGLINTISIIIISKKLLICGNPVIYRRFDSKLLLLSMKDYGKFQVLI